MGGEFNVHNISNMSIAFFGSNMPSCMHNLPSCMHNLPSCMHNMPSYIHNMSSYMHNLPSWIQYVIMNAQLAVIRPEPNNFRNNRQYWE